MGRESVHEVVQGAVVRKYEVDMGVTALCHYSTIIIAVSRLVIRTS